MPARKLPMPEDAAILAKAQELAARGRTSRAQLAEALGVNPSTFNVAMRRDRRKLLERVDLILTGVLDPGKPQDPQRVKIDQQAAELKALRKDNAEYAKLVASREAFLEAMAEAARQPVRMRELHVAPQRKDLPKRAVVAPIFDCQYGQQVLPEDTPGGRGTYSPAIFDRNLVRWLEGVTGSLRDYAASHTITELVIPMGGDFVEGHGIFPGQEWQLALDPPRQVWEFATKMGGDEASGITGALPELIAYVREELGVKRVRIYVVPGNHGKVGGKKAGALHSTHSWDWLVGMILRDKLAGHQLQDFAIEPGGAVYFGVAAHTFLMIHGDEIKGWGGIPFYGLARQDAKAIRQGHVIHDYLLLGDKHRPAEISQGGGSETLMSGAWVGDNNLSRSLGAGALPQQRVYYLSDKWGITESARIPFETAAVGRQPATIR